MSHRTQIIERIKDQPEPDVLIIGGGINGIGTFRDLALQKVSCLLVEQGDFCSGASMASSHMLHGGIRYLENGEFRLVREALHERSRLLRNAPHLTHPLPTTIPIFKYFSGLFNAPLKFLGLLDRPAERGAVVIKLGLMVYDAYVRGDSPMPDHTFLNREQALEKWPHLNPDIQFAATYYDGAMPSPERLALEILLDGIQEGEHARALNYLRAVDAEGERITLEDQISGDTFSVQPQVVVNAGGPWIDFINRDIDGETDFVGGTKGSHLILDHPQLREAIGDHEFFFEYFDGRIVLIFPYRERVLLGTTDIRIEHPDQARCTEEEIEYILGMVPRVFPDLEVSRKHIVFQFSGVRPLPPAEGVAGQISRDHAIQVVESGEDLPWPILSLVGGKWTSYRAFSEQAADAVLNRLGKPRLASTRDVPIGGGRQYPGNEKLQQAWIEKVAAESGIHPHRAAQLFERYGTRAEDFLAYLSRKEDRPLAHHPAYSVREVQYLARQEMIAHLDDFILRRSLLAWLGEVNLPLLQELSHILGGELGWSEGEIKQEIQRAQDVLAQDHGVML